MEHYRKLIVAVIGLALMLGHKHLGIDLTAQEGSLVEVVIAILTAAGVYQVSNKEKS